MSAEITFGGWLRQQRKERGLAADTVAERIGCSAITLIKIESGARRPSRQMGLLLAQFFAVPADEQEAFIAFARNGVAAPAAAAVPWRSAQSHHTNLPLALTNLLGRAAEVEQASALLLQPRLRLLTITGAPGIGKTRLALEVASRLLDHFDDGVYLIELALIDDPDAVPDAIARALGLQEGGDDSIAATLAEYLRDRRILLLLDNFEHLLDAALTVIRLLESSHWLKVLVTSREALHVRGERRYLLQPLALPDLSQPSDPQTRGDSPALQLLVERAQDADPNFVLDDSNVSDLAALCVALEGLPLAIELAAARASYFSSAEMRGHLTSRLKLLTGGPRDLPPRQRTLRNALEWSYDLLTPAEQTLFRRLGVFVGGFTLPAVAAIWEPKAALETLQSLEAKSLLRRETQASGGPRFGLLEALREFAREKIAPAELSQAQRLHAAYFLQLAEHADLLLRGAEQGEWLAQLEREHGNLRAALAWTLGAAGDEEWALRLVVALWRFWWVHGHITEGREWTAFALRRASAAPPTRRARAASCAGNLAWAQTDYAAARALHQQALALYRKLEDRSGTANALNNLSLVASTQGDFAEARLLGEESLALKRELGDKMAIASSLNNMGILARTLEDDAQAQALFAESLDLYRELEDKSGIANSLNNVGLATEALGDHATARACYEESLALHRELGMENGSANSLLFLGILALKDEQYAQATALLTEALALYDKVGNRSGRATVLSSLGESMRAQGETARARALMEGSLALFRQIGERGSLANVLHDLGELLRDQGEYGAARELFEESLSIHREIGQQKGAARLLTALADIAYLQGDFPQAGALYEESLALKQALNYSLAVPASICGLGAVAIALGEAGRGAALLGEGQALHEATDGSDRPVPLIVEQATATAIARLGEADFRQAWADGHSRAAIRA